MSTFRTFRSLLLVAAAALVVSKPGLAQPLENLAASDVLTSFEFADGLSDALLSLNDTNVGAIASLNGAGDVNLSALQVTLSLPLIEELGDGGDSIAQGRFGPGTIMMVDTSAPGPGVVVFQADVDELILAEDPGNGGMFAGAGSFSGAIYGGVLASITGPSSGEVFTDLFRWYLDPGLSMETNIDNFSDMQDLIVYGDMQLNFVPEPGTLLLLGSVVAWPRRRSPAHRLRR